MAAIAAVLNQSKHYWAILTSLALALIALSLCSAQFNYTLPFSATWTVVNFGLMVIAGMAFIGLIALLSRSHFSLPHRVYPLVFLGLALRLLFVPSTPILEDDFYRYFFDGTLSVEGHNPYQYKPADAYPKIKKGIVEDEFIEANPDLLYLRDISTFNRVAYPEVKTIYPLAAQGVFALSAMLNPFDLTVWRLLLIGFELMSLLLIIKLLKALNLPPLLFTLYWLNPLIITEGINAAHMDVILVPFLLAILLFIHSKRYIWAGIFLSLAVAVKVWPLLLVVPIAAFIFQSCQCNSHKKGSVVNTLQFLMTVALASTLLFIPQLTALEADAGIVKYAQLWQVNSFLFSLLNEGIQTGLSWLSSDYLITEWIETGRLARILIALIVCGIALVTSWRLLISSHQQSIHHLTASFIWIALGLFLLSPTGYPWYCFWFFPFLPFLSFSRFLRAGKTWPILILVVTLPLYDLRYIAEDSQNPMFWQWVIATLTFGPVISLLAREWWGDFRRNDAKTRPSPS